MSTNNKSLTDLALIWWKILPMWRVTTLSLVWKHLGLHFKTQEYLTNDQILRIYLKEH